MTPDEFRKALDEYDARRARHGDDRSLLHSETSPFFAELTRRAREHLAAESALDAVEASSYITAPCVVCGANTVLACSDCAIDSGGRESVHVCDNRECRNRHEASAHNTSGGSSS